MLTLSLAFTGHAARGAWQPPKEAGPYSIKTSTISLKNPRGSAVVTYPVGTDGNVNASAAYPFISFAHGGGAGLDLTEVNYEADMKIIASFGFVVVATEVNEGGSDPTFSKQQLAVIETCSSDTKLHPSFASVDFTKCGVAGHSMGAMASAESAADGGKGGCIKAGWAQHICNDGFDDSKISVPFLFTTGSADGLHTRLDRGTLQLGDPSSFFRR